MSSQNWKFFFQKKKTFMFTLSDLFSETQQKSEKSCECGTFRKRCMTRVISAFAIIPNGPQITKGFSWYTYKQKKKEKRKKL